MPSRSIPGHEPPEHAASAGAPSPYGEAPTSDLSPTVESDFASLANRLAEHGNGIFSMQLSADLALEIVLNEIVEQACLTMRATGAAIILEREDEMVCRACSGPTAPGLGTRLDTQGGLSGECVRTLHSQRCDDAQSDPRADIEACRKLGVRSVMVLPLIRKERLVGVFEVFCSEPFAFGEREERTAEAFAHRIVKNLERASEPLTVSTVAPAPADTPLAEENPAVEPSVLQSLQAGLASIAADDEMPARENAPAPRNRGFEIFTWVLAVAVLICIFLLGQRFILRRAARVSAKTVLSAQKPIANATKPDGVASNSPVTPGPQTSVAPATKSAETKNGETKSAEAKPSDEKKLRPTEAAPVGSLLVYQNGREVFRMDPSQANSTAASTAATVERASAVEPDNVMQLSPDAIEGSLLHRVEPQYPEEARQQQIQGPVVLDVRIAPDGSVQEVGVVSGPPLLADAAINAVKQWRFRPHTSHGVPAEMQTRITLNFKLPE